MAATLEDARIVVKIDTASAEAAAEEMLRKRRSARPGGGGGMGGGGGGGAAPPGAPGDTPEPQDGGGKGPGLGLAAGLAKNPNLVYRVVGDVALVELAQSLAQIAVGLAAPREDDPWIKAELKKLIAWPMEQIGNRIGDLENIVRGIFNLASSAHVAIDQMGDEALVGETPDIPLAGATFSAQMELGFADADLRQLRRKLRRGMIGKAVQDKEEELMDKVRTGIGEIWEKH